MPYKFSNKLKSVHKSAIIIDVSDATGWEPLVYDPAGTGERVENPVSREQWVHNKVDDFIRSIVREHRLGIARADAEATVLAGLDLSE
mgnify:CR=1 FL=1